MPGQPATQHSRFWEPSKREKHRVSQCWWEQAVLAVQGADFWGGRVQLPRGDLTQLLQAGSSQIPNMLGFHFNFSALQDPSLLVAFINVTSIKTTGITLG